MMDYGLSYFCPVWPRRGCRSWAIDKHEHCGRALSNRKKETERQRRTDGAKDG